MFRMKTELFIFLVMLIISFVYNPYLGVLTALVGTGILVLIYQTYISLQNSTEDKEREIKRKMYRAETVFANEFNRYLRSERDPIATRNYECRVALLDERFIPGRSVFPNPPRKDTPQPEKAVTVAQEHPEVSRTDHQSKPRLKVASRHNTAN